MEMSDNHFDMNKKESYFEELVGDKNTLSQYELVLYYKPSCPYCIKVMDFLKKKGISLKMKDTSQETNKQELIEVGGKKQVPCLLIDKIPLYESDDIIGWIDLHKNEF